MPSLTLFTKDNCHYCRVIIQELAFLSLSDFVKKRNIDVDKEARDLLQQSGAVQVPCLLVEDCSRDINQVKRQWVYGVDKITDLLRSLPTS